MKCDEVMLMELRIRRRELVKQKNWPEVLEVITKSIAIQPTFERYYNRGCVLLQLQRFQEAAHNFRKSVEMNSQFEKGRKAMIKVQSILNNTEQKSAYPQGWFDERNEVISRQVKEEKSVSRLSSPKNKVADSFVRENVNWPHIEKYKSTMSEYKQVIKKNLRDIETDTWYEGCSFHIDRNIHTIKNCVFHNCSFRGERLVVFHITQVKFLNCNIDRLQIKEPIEETTELEFIGGNVHILEIYLKKVNDYSFVRSLKIPEKLYVYIRPIKVQELDILARLTNLYHLKINLDDVYMEVEELFFLRNLKKLNTLTVYSFQRYRTDCIMTNSVNILNSLPKLKIFNHYPGFKKTFLKCTMKKIGVFDAQEYEIGEELEPLQPHWSRYLCTKDGKKYIYTMCNRRPGGRKEFMEEMSNTSRITHPAIMKIEDCYVDDDRPCYITNFFDGENLEAIVKREKTLSVNFTCKVALHLLQVINVAHELSIVHEEMHPNLVFVTANEEIKLQWSLPKTNCYISNYSARYYKERNIPILNFMPLDLLQNNCIHPCNDVYAIGAIIYFLLCGEPPYKGKTNDVIHKMMNNEKYPSLEERVPHLPRKFLDIVTKAMSVEAKLRYQKARDMYDDLKCFYQILEQHEF